MRWLVAALGVVLLACADRAGLLLVRRPNDLAAYDGVRARVVRAVDPVTIEIARPDAKLGWPTTHVQVWGVRPRGGDGPGVGRTDRLVSGRLVVLRLESHRTRGAMGRLLAHVELPDRTLLGEELLTRGVALPDDRHPHEHVTRYARAAWNAAGQK